MTAESEAWETADLAARETAIITGREVVTIARCAYVPHGITTAAQTGVIAATPTELIYVGDKSPREVVRHPLDPARQPAITASRLLPGRLDFGDGRIFVLPSKNARAIKESLAREINNN